MSDDGRDAVVVDVVRTTLGKREGALANWHPADLLGFALTRWSDAPASTPDWSTTSSAAASPRWGSRAPT